MDNETLRLVLEAMRAEDEVSLPSFLAMDAQASAGRAHRMQQGAQQSSCSLLPSQRLAQVASFRTAYLRAESLRMEVELHQHRAEQQRRNSVMTGSPLAEPRSPPPPYLPPSFPSLPPLSSTNAYTRNADGERKRWPSGSDRFASPAFGQRRYRSTDDYAPANRPQHPHVSPLLDRERGTASPFAARGSIPGRVLYESPMASPRAFAPLPHHSPAASPSPHGMHVHSPSPSSSSSTNSRAGQKRRWTEGEVEEAARVKVEEMEVDTPSVQSTTSRASSCSISPLSHQEIMARLQLKVKSRLAAKERGELPSGPNAASTSGSSRSRAGKSSSSKSKAAGTDSSKTKAKDTPSRRTSLPVPAPSEPTPARAALGIDTLLCAAAVAEERALGLHQAHPHP